MNNQTLSAPLAQVDEIILSNGLTMETASSLRLAFEPMFTEAEKWRVKAQAIKVTDVSQTREMKLARECRLALREIRINVESKRKGLKEDSLRKGKAIDGLANIAKYLIEPVEEYLLEQEKFAERQAERERAERLDRRHAELQPLYDFTGPVHGLADMSDEQFAMLLDGAKAAKARKEEEARKAEEERLAAIKAEAEERERIRLENERLRKEAEKARAKAEAERAKLDAQRRAVEEKARKEREAAEAALKAERDKAEKLRQEALAKAAEEQRIANAKAEAERNAAAMMLAQERAAREKLEREAIERKKAEDAKRRAEEAAAKKAALAPEADKLHAFAAQVRGLAVPSVTSPEARAVAADITEKIESFAKWIETKAATL